MRYKWLVEVRLSKTNILFSELLKRTVETTDYANKPIMLGITHTLRYRPPIYEVSGNLSSSKLHVIGYRYTHEGIKCCFIVLRSNVPCLYHTSYIS